MTIGDYRTEKGLKLEELAEKLGISKGHASDLCTGKQPVSIRIAKRMAKLTGKPWHTFISERSTARPARAKAAAA